MDCNDKLPVVSEILGKHSNIFCQFIRRQRAFFFWSDTIFPAFWVVTTNMKYFLPPSRLKGNQHPSSASAKLHAAENGGSKCDRNCDLCKNYFMKSAPSQSCATGRSYKIKHRLNCSSANVIYLATYAKCSLQYVGSTSTEFKVRFRNRKTQSWKQLIKGRAKLRFMDSPIKNFATLWVK